MDQSKKLLAEGGMMDDSGEQVNGVEVPPGSLREEVADDIPAQLSEGEFVVPADVVRYIGLEKLMAMRDKAKQGLQRMEEMGQMGNAEEVDDPDQTFGQSDEDFSAEIDNIMAEEGDAVTSDEPVGFARGGFASGTDLTKATRNPMVDVRFFKNKEGKVMFITHINGVPLVPIPKGFEETDESYEQLVGNEADKKAAEEEAANAEELKRLAALGMGTSGGESGSVPTTPTTPSSSTSDAGKDLSRSITIDPKTGEATAKDYSNYAKLASLVVPGPIGVAILAGAKIDANRNKDIADQWNSAERYFNPEYSKEDQKETGWVSMAFAKDTGTGFTVDGRSIGSIQSVQAQNDSLFNLTAAEKAMYAVPGTAEANAQRDAAQTDSMLSKSIVQGESRARQAAREKAEAEAKAAEAKAAEAQAAARQAADRSNYSTPSYSYNEGDYSFMGPVSPSSGGGSSSGGGGFGGGGGYGGGGGVDGGGYGGGASMAKGGIVKKRGAKAKTTKKGIASRK